MWGYSVIETINVEELRTLLSRLGRYDPNSEVLLTPKEVSQSISYSLSGTYGKSIFPWHTDGAVALHPPRFVAMFGANIDSRAPGTDLLDCHALAELATRTRRSLLDVRLKSGRVIQLRASEVRNGIRMFRWDSRVCTPRCDATLSRYLETLQPTTSVDWKTGRGLIFDNWRMLHRRPAINDSSVRVIWRAYSY